MRHSRFASAVGDGVGLDRDRPFPVDQCFTAWQGVDLWLKIFVLEATRWWSARVDRESVFCEPATVGTHEPRRTFVLSHDFGHAGDGVERSIVEGAAAKGESSSDGEGPGFGYAQLRCGDLHGRWEAAVEIEVLDIIDRLVGEFECAVARKSHRW